MDDEVASGRYPKYKAVGMGYIRFAKEEKELFKYVMMHREASKLHMHMWIFVHGIASIFATKYIDIDWENVSQMVTDAYMGIIKQIKGEKNDN